MRKISFYVFSSALSVLLSLTGGVGLLEEPSQLCNVRLSHLQCLILGELMCRTQAGQYPTQPVKTLIQQVHSPPLPRIRRQPPSLQLLFGQRLGRRRRVGAALHAGARTAGNKTASVAATAAAVILIVVLLRFVGEVDR